MDFSLPVSKQLQLQLEVLKAQNARLQEENTLLRHKLNRLTSEQKTNSTLNVEAQINALQLENERDRMFENLERLKKKYNKLHDAYLEKVKDCKAYEDMFKQQKHLTGLVMKSALDQREKEQKLMLQKRAAAQAAESSATHELEVQVGKLQSALDAAYDIIDELEFELESIDFLEMENQRLQQELKDLKAQTQRGSMPPGSFRPEEAPLRGDELDEQDTTTNRLVERRLNACDSIRESVFNGDDADSASLERAALTNSLIQTAEAESQRLRRELLKYRLENILRPGKKESDT